MADKKEKNSVKLPKAWKSVKNRNDMSQAKGNYEAIGGLIVAIITIALIAFVLLGGISQRGLINFCFDWSHNVMDKVSSWMEGGGIEVTDDGIYLNPNAIPNGGGSVNQNESQNENQDKEQNNSQNEDQNEISNTQ